MNFEQAIKDIQDTLIVVGVLQAKQASAQKLHGEELDATRAMLREGLAAHEKRMAEHEERMADHEKRMSDHQEWLADHDKSMADLDERIRALLPGFGEFKRQLRERN